ncbi:MAG TPA: cyclopropane-fatty-acyl-phospholipid synthase family protein [Vicinamibacteria bacterium]|nr:cyclopropane-fatty-acyl-phospholipid synthase family protein [Vicinamibacteria bacterium]
MGALADAPERTAPVGALDRGLRWLFRRAVGEAPLRFALAGGEVVYVPQESAVATVVFRDLRALVHVLSSPESRFGEAYANGDVAVEGDLVGALEAVYLARERRAKRWSAWRVGHPPEEARENAQRHYDLGNAFYRPWLGDSMVYTCAYFPTPDATLEAAQTAKMELVCRKLALSEGDRVVEAGCGWGALARYMVRSRGVRVTAYNVSREQVCWAREQAVREGLAKRVAFIEDDYRRIDGSYDVFVSVGMLEHVGPLDYPTLGSVIDRCLDHNRGRGLLHFIGRDRPQPLNPWIRRWIFPGAYPPTLGEAVRGVLEPAGLAVLDVENLRPHYALTLRHWRERFEAAADDVSARFGRPFARSWRLYLAGSEAAFRTGSMELFQVTFARPGVAWTRPSPP